MKRVILLPTLVTLGNAFCGVLALSKAVDALAYAGAEPGMFYRKMEVACLLVFLGMVFDTLDGWVARVTRGFSSFGAQLDSFADALTFGLVPAMLAKVLIEHEAEVSGYVGNPRISFLAAAAFAIMAMLRLVRFNLENEKQDPKAKGGHFRGLPSPAAAGCVAATIWLYLILRRPELELSQGTPTPLSNVMAWMEVVKWGPFLDLVPLLLVLLLPTLGVLMVSNVPYLHGTRFLRRGRGQFFTLVGVVFAAFLFHLAPVPILFLVFSSYVILGLVMLVAPGLRRRSAVV